MKLPALQFYPGDWRKDPGVQSLGYHDRGVWFEILLLMHESNERGVLLLGSKPMPESALSQLLGLDKQILTTTLTTLLEFGVASRREDGALFCRRMVRDEELRYIRSEAGKLGGNPILLKQKSTTDLSSPEDEDEDEKKMKVKKKDLLRIGPHFACTQDQRDALSAEDGEEAFLARVETINDYCAAHGKRYKDYPAAYRQFRKRDQDRTPIVTGGSPGVFKSAREKQLEREAAALETVGLFFDDLERDKAEQKKLNGGKNDQRRISHHS